MIREYNGKRYDMSKVPRPWRDYTSSKQAKAALKTLKEVTNA